MELNKRAYSELIEQDLAYLSAHCGEGDLELGHIVGILRSSIGWFFPKHCYNCAMSCHNTPYGDSACRGEERFTKLGHACRIWTDTESPSYTCPDCGLERDREIAIDYFINGCPDCRRERGEISHPYICEPAKGNRHDLLRIKEAKELEERRAGEEARARYYSETYGIDIHGFVCEKCGQRGVDAWSIPRQLDDGSFEHTADFRLSCPNCDMHKIIKINKIKNTIT